MPFRPGVTSANKSRNRKRLRQQRSGPACLLLKTILPVISRGGELDCGIFRLSASKRNALLAKHTLDARVYVRLHPGTTPPSDFRLQPSSDCDLGLRLGTSAWRAKRFKLALTRVVSCGDCRLSGRWAGFGPPSRIGIRCRRGLRFKPDDAEAQVRRDCAGAHHGLGVHFCDQCLKWRIPVKTMAMPSRSAAAITS